MSSQIQEWEGHFGNEYTDRNVLDWQKRVPAFRRMLFPIKIAKVLEIGCNRGHNLVTLLEILGEKSEIVGIEPNQHALQIARKASANVGVLRGDVFDLPFKDGYFDLVFTAGVLIHIPLEGLADAMKEIVRVSNRYVLAIEYFAERETIVPYRNHDDLLWKRDFNAHYQALFPSLKLIDGGFWSMEDGFDESHWWLLEK